MPVIARQKARGWGEGDDEKGRLDRSEARGSRCALCFAAATYWLLLFHVRIVDECQIRV